MKNNILLGTVFCATLFFGGALLASATTLAPTTAEVPASDIAALTAKVEMLMKQIAEMQAAIAAQKKEIQVLREELQLTRRLGKGDQGDEVKLLQQVLATDPAIYPEAKVTGFYGDLTEKAVKRFQAKAGLESVGQVGPKTREMLNRLLTDGAGASGVVPPGLLREYGTYATAKLAEQNTSGVWGHAKMAATSDGKTRVVVELVRRDTMTLKPETTGGVATTVMPVLPEGPYPAHIHAGACPTPGEVAYPLAPVTNGRSETTLEVRYEDLMKRLPLAVNLHKSVDALATYVACGDVHMPTAAWSSVVTPQVVNPSCPVYNACQSGYTTQTFVNPNGCTVLKCIPPATTAASLVATPSQGVAPLVVTFSGSVNSAGYSIDFGDGTTSGDIGCGHGSCTTTQTTNVSASHTYATAGTYTAKLRRHFGATEGNCAGLDCNVVARATITVTASTVTFPTTSSLIATPSQGIAPLTVAFSGSVDSAGYLIDFGDGATSENMGCGYSIECAPTQSSTNVSASHTYTASGSYLAKLRRHFSGVNCQGTDCDVVARTTVTVTGPSVQ